MKSKIQNTDMMNASTFANYLIQNEIDQEVINAQVKGLIALVHGGGIKQAVAYATAVFSALYSDSATGYGGTIKQLKMRQKNARKSFIRKVNSGLKKIHGSESEIVLNNKNFQITGKNLRHIQVSTTGNQHTRRIKISFPIVKPMDETGDTSTTATNGENTVQGEPMNGGGNVTTTAAGKDASNKSEHNRMLALSQSPDALASFVKNLNKDMFKRLVAAVEHRQASDMKALEQAGEQAKALEQAGEQAKALEQAGEQAKALEQAAAH